MALVECPECRGAVSDSAAACPHCGHPMASGKAVFAGRAGRGGLASPSAEEILWQGTPSLRLLLVEAVKTAVVVAAVVVGVVLAYGPLRRLVVELSKGGDAARYLDGLRLAVTLFVVTVVVVRIASLAWRAVSLRHHTYRVSNQRLTVETGVIAKSLVEVDMRTVDDITFNQGVVERLLKLGRIDIVSSEPSGAVGSHTRLTLVGVSGPRAVRETIRNAVYQATHGQLFTRST